MIKGEFEKIYKVPVQHYFKNGKSLDGKYATIPSGAHRENDPVGYCSECLAGVRKQTIQAYALRDAGDETKNVIDYKVTAAKDKPESATSGHA